MASYLDQGNPEVEESALSVQEKIIFRGQRLQLERADEMTEGLGIWNRGEDIVVGQIKHDVNFRFDKISFKGLKQVQLSSAVIGS